MQIEFPDKTNEHDMLICELYRHLDYLMNDEAKMATINEWAKLSGRDKIWSDRAWESYNKFRRARLEQKFLYYYCGVLVKNFGPKWLRDNFPESRAAEMIKDTDTQLTTWMAVCCDETIHREMMRVPNAN